MTLTIYQEGGDPSQLGKAFEKDSTGSYYFMKCEMRDMGSCQHYLSGLIDYAKD